MIRFIGWQLKTSCNDIRIIDVNINEFDRFDVLKTMSFLTKGKKFQNLY